MSSACEKRGHGSCVTVAALLFCALLTPDPLGAEPRTLRDVVYDLAVTSYCGLLTPEVEFGYHREIADLTARAELGEEAAKALRIAGWVDADREWSNRGLGGFRAWCETDGVKVAKHFLGIVRAAQ